MKTPLRLFAAIIALVSANQSQAAFTTYSTPGTVNGASYSFTAAADGDVVAYFVGSTAGYGSVIGLSINGAAPLTFGLQNNSTAFGTSFNMGAVSAGDVLRFVLAVDQGSGLGPTDPFDLSIVDYYLNSDEALNPVAGEQHFFSSPYTGGDVGFPASGTYVGIEDISPLSAPGNDLDYDDHQFVFTNVAAVSTPEGGTTLAMMGVSLLGVAVLRRRFRK